MSSATRIWTEEVGEGPLVAVAIHDGHELRPEVRDALRLGEDDRLREEDPCTGAWTRIVPTRLVALRSRFEVDLNRPRHKAVYRAPADCWGLEAWKRPPPDELVARSLAGYDAFYARLEEILRARAETHGRFVLLDMHSYNHRRRGPAEPPDDPLDNPQINVGTGTMQRQRWSRIVDRFMADLRAHDFPTGPLDVRENVRFTGGQLVRWLHRTFPETGCGLAIEVKKFYMDEWTGEIFPKAVASVHEALASAIFAIERELS